MASIFSSPANQVLGKFLDAWHAKQKEVSLFPATNGNVAGLGTAADRRTPYFALLAQSSFCSQKSKITC